MRGMFEDRRINEIMKAANGGLVTFKPYIRKPSI